MRLYNCCIHHSLSRLTYFLESCKQIFELMMHCTKYAKYIHAHKNRNKIEELYKNSWQYMLNSVQCHKIIVIIISEHQTRIQNRYIYMQLTFLLKTKKTDVTQKTILVRQQYVCITMLCTHLAYIMYSHIHTQYYSVILKLKIGTKNIILNGK